MKNLAIAAILLAAGIAPLQAQTLDAGRLLASNCFQCHGTAGKGGGFDSLAGDSRADLIHEMSEFRVKAARKDIMSAHARGYTNEQISLIADYFARQSGQKRN